MELQTIALITGGANSERDISFVSAQAVEKALRKKGYTDIIMIDYPSEYTVLLDFLESDTFDFARVMIHGVGGEDGEVQRLLDQYALPYQTAPASVMQLTMDKYLTKLERKKAGLPVAPSLIVDTMVDDIQEVHFAILEHVKYPCIAKDTREGSSVGITLIHHQQALGIWRENKDNQRQYLIEQFILGKEITVGVWDSPMGILEALPPIWIRHGKEIRDYSSKYDPTTEELCPPPLPAHDLLAYQQLAVAAYEAVGMQQYGRVDMMVGDDGPILLEINGIPGFTPTSLFPKAAMVAGYSFDDVVEHLMWSAVHTPLSAAQ